MGPAAAERHPVRVARFKFEAIPWGADRWFPIGKAKNGDDVFVDGCVITDKQLAERIAMNMEAAYNQGVEDAAREIVQHASRMCDAVGTRISDTASALGGLVVFEDDEDDEESAGDDDA